MLPLANGLNFTLILQLVPGSSLEQAFVSMKPGVMPILDTVSAAVPMFDSVTVLDVLVVPTL